MPFSHNTFVTDKETTERRHIVPRFNLTIGYSKGNKIITVDFHESWEIFQCKCVLLFYFYLFLTVSQNECLGDGRYGTAVFRENLVAICTHDRRLWI